MSAKNMQAIGILVLSLLISHQSWSQQQQKFDLIFVIEASIPEPSNYNYQLEGIASAIENSEVVPTDGSVRVALMQFGTMAILAIPFTKIASSDSARALATRIRSLDPANPKPTGILKAVGEAIYQAGILSKTGQDSLARQIISFSTDGLSNFGRDDSVAAKSAMANGVDVLDFIVINNNPDIIGHFGGLSFPSQQVRSAQSFNQLPLIYKAMLGSLLTGVRINNSQEVVLPTSFLLEQNFPNPFNPVTTIRYALPKNEQITLKVYSLFGEEVATLIKDERKAAGYHVVMWDGKNAAGRMVASGVYFVQMRAGDFVQTRKMLLLE